MSQASLSNLDNRHPLADFLSWLRRLIGLALVHATSLGVHEKGNDETVQTWSTLDVS